MTESPILPTTPFSIATEDDLAHDAQAVVMKQKMQNDVAAWAASRADAPSQPLVAPRSANRRLATGEAVKPAAPRSAAKPAVPTAPSGPRKPFAMKYDGRPAARYAAERFDRGAR